MRTVLHQGNTAVASDFAQTIEIGWVSAHMYRNDGFCPLGNAGFNQVGIDAVRIRQDIYHDRESSGEQDGAGRRDKGEVGNDDFIAGANIESGHHDFKRGSAVSDRNAMPGAVERGKRPLKFQSLGSRGSPPDPALQDFRQCTTFLLVVHGPVGKRFGFRFAASQ